MKAEQIRNAMGPEFCAVADGLRETFDAKLVFLETPTVKIGKDPAIGSVRTDKPDTELERLAFWYGRRSA